MDLKDRARRMYAPRKADDRTIVRAGVGVLIWDNRGRILMEKRSDSGAWGFPGGRIDPGESITQTAVRESLEETGFTVVVTRLVGVYSGPDRRIVTFPDGNVVQLIDIFVEAKILSGTLLPKSPESETLRFFSPAELPPKEDLAPPSWEPLEDALQGNIGVIR